MKRLLNLINALWNKLFDTIEDPEIMIDLARRNMIEVLEKNRERAIRAMTERNKIKMLVDTLDAQSRQCERQATIALQQGNEALAREFMRDKVVKDGTLKDVRASLVQADMIVDNVKKAVANQEADAKKKAAEALALKARYKSAQVQNAIMKALDGLSFDNPLGDFGSAKEKIDAKVAEASARSEMFAGSIAGQTMTLESDAADIAAEEELNAMKARLGLASNPTPVENSETVQQRLS